MFRTLRLTVLVAAGLIAAGAVPRWALASSDGADMAKLPLSEPFLCLTCHDVAEPDQAGYSLNPFGEDFLSNGRVWDLNIANLDSDGDKCTNGVELGDVDGDGEPDGNVEKQGSNPGEPDGCGSSGLVDEKTWGALKAMFDRP